MSLRRREFLAGLGGSAAWPLAARAQQGERVRRIGVLTAGGSRGWARYYSPNGAKFIRIGNLQRQSIALDLEDIQRVSLPSSVEGQRTRLQAGDILVSITAELGLVGLVGEGLGEAYVNQHIALVRPFFNEFTPYVARYLISPEGQASIGAANRGVTRAGLGLDDIRALELPVPPLPEQRRIVAKIDSLASKSKRARDQLDCIPRLVAKYKQAILAAAFRGELTAEWRARRLALAVVNPRNEADKRRSPSSLFDPPYSTPPSWRWLRLPEIGDIDRGKSRHRPRNDPALFGGAYPFIQTGDVRAADRFLTSYTDTYNELGLSQSRLWPVGTLCITIAANIAETALLTFDACFPDSVVGFVADDDKVDASYVEFFLRTARAELEAFAPATAQKNINLETLSNIRVPVPPVLEQKEIVSRTDAAFTWIDRLASEANTAHKLIDHLDQAVLAKAFRGELVPQDLNDEPASVLLERIRAQRQTPGTVPSQKKQSKPRRGRKK
jgi:type I restriction enzyme S subunit